MSNLNSIFNVLAGVPPHDRSAMEGNFKQAAGESPVLSEGMIAKIAQDGTTGNPVVTALTSANCSATVIEDYPWLVIEGMDQSDAAFANKVTCLACKTGVIFKVYTTVSLAIGDLVYANAGVLAKVDAAQQAIGEVIEAYPNASTPYAVVAC